MLDRDTAQKVMGSRLRHDEARSTPEWTLWEHKTLNIHRAVIEWHPLLPATTTAAIQTAVRAKVAQTYTCSWWRGFGYGVLVDLPALPTDLQSCADLIDARDNPKGTWQWILMLAPASRKALGIHTWINGYLTPVYQSLVNNLRANGYAVDNHVREKDGLLKLLTALSDRKFDEFNPR